MTYLILYPQFLSTVLEGVSEVSHSVLQGTSEISPGNHDWKDILWFCLSKYGPLHCHHLGAC